MCVGSGAHAILSSVLIVSVICIVLMSVSFKREHAPLRTATGWVLTSPALKNMLSDFEQLLPSLNHLGVGIDDEACGCHPSSESLKI